MTCICISHFLALFFYHRNEIFEFETSSRFSRPHVHKRKQNHSYFRLVLTLSKMKNHPELHLSTLQECPTLGLIETKK